MITSGSVSSVIKILFALLEIHRTERGGVGSLCSYLTEPGDRVILDP